MPSFAMGKELAGLSGLFNRFVTGPATGAALFNQGRAGSSLHRALLSTPSTRNTDAGKALGEALGIAPGIANLENEMRYMNNQLQRGSLPYLGNEMRYATNAILQGRNPYGRPLNAIETRNYGPGYKEKELAAGAAAEQFRPGAGFPGQQGAADRAYQQELSSTSQLTAQDPELKRYADARKLAVAPGATPEQVQSAEDIGMQIWQQKYGNTPLGQPGGAIGRKNPLMEEFFGYQTGMSPQQMQEMQATAAPVPVAPGEIPYQQGDLGTRVTLETGYDPAQYGLSPNLVEEMKKHLLQQAGK